MEDKNGISTIHVEKVKVEDIPTVITQTFGDITEIDKSINASQAMGGSAKSLALYASGKEAGWSVTGKKKEEAIEALQDAAVKQANALISSNSAIKQLFENQKKFANAIQFLFALGVTNIAANRTVVRELELKLKNASKEELSELARKEIENVILQLRAQEDMFKRLEGHDSLLREHKDSVEKLNNSINTMKIKIEELSKKINDLENQLSKESFFDSIIYKIALGIISFVAIIFSVLI